MTPRSAVAADGSLPSLRGPNGAARRPVNRGHQRARPPASVSAHAHRAGAAEERPADADQLPFEPRTLLLSLWRRRRQLLLWTALAGVAGIGGGLLFGSRVYEAETVMLYAAPEGGAASLLTEMNLVKIQPNLEAVRDRLQLRVPLAQLGAACRVDVRPQTNLLSVRVNWGSAEGAAAIANNLRDQFLESQRQLREAALGGRVRDLEEQRQGVRQQLDAAEEALRRYTAENGLVEADNEVQALLDQLGRVDRLYQQAQAEKDGLDQHGISAALTGRGGDAPPAVQSLGLEDVEGRLQGLLSTMRGSREQQANQALLERARTEYERAQQLIEKGLIPQSQVDEARAEYEQAQALAGDTEQSRQWRTRVGALMTERLDRLNAARQRLREQIDQLPQLQRGYVSLKRDVSFHREELQSLDERIAQLRRAYESTVPDFRVVSEAHPPAMPLSSNRKVLAVGIVLLGSVVAFAVTLARELLDATVKSPEELELKLRLPALAALPRADDPRDLSPLTATPAARERFRSLAHRVRTSMPAHGARLLVVSVDREEGATGIAANLAAALGRQDEQVLLVDAAFRPEGHEAAAQAAAAPVPEHLLVDDEAWAAAQRFALRDLACSDAQGPRGLGEYLSYEVEAPGAAIWPTPLPGVACCPRLGEPVVTDLVGSRRMAEFLETASARFSVVVVDAPPLGEGVQCEWLARWCDAAILVVRSRHTGLPALRRATDRLRATGCPVTGVVLNDVEALYLRQA